MPITKVDENTYKITVEKTRSVRDVKAGIDSLKANLSFQKDNLLAAQGAVRAISAEIFLLEKELAEAKDAGIIFPDEQKVEDF